MTMTISYIVLLVVSLYLIKKPLQYFLEHKNVNKISIEKLVKTGYVTDNRYE